MLPGGSPGIGNPPTYVRGPPFSAGERTGLSERGGAGCEAGFMNEEGGPHAGPATPGGHRGASRPRDSKGD